MKLLRLQDPLVIKGGFNRPNIQYTVGQDRCFAWSSCQLLSIVKQAPPTTVGSAALLIGPPG